MSSEIARIRQQIELESAAMRLAMYGFATVATHEFISHRYDAIGKCQEKLRTLVGEEQASEITVETYNHIMERDEGDMHSSKGLTPPVPLHQLKTPPMIDEAKKTMREHGCEIVEDIGHCAVLVLHLAIRLHFGSISNKEGNYSGILFKLPLKTDKSKATITRILHDLP